MRYTRLFMTGRRNGTLPFFYSAPGTFKIISDRYYRCESPATFPVRGVLSFFTGNTCMNPSDAI
ncbi:hypothetical protein C9Z43_24660, partial [Escherichia coli]